MLNRAGEKKPGGAPGTQLCQKLSVPHPLSGKRRLFSAFYKRYCQEVGGGGGEKKRKEKLMLKSRKKQQKGQGQQLRQKQLPRPAQHRHKPALVAQAAAAEVTTVATAVRRPGFSSGLQRRGSEWGVPIASIFWASTFFSFLHSRLLSVSWPAAASPSPWGLAKPPFSFPRSTPVTPGFVLVGVPAASGASCLSQLDLGLSRVCLRGGPSNPKAFGGWNCRGLNKTLIFKVDGDKPRHHLRGWPAPSHRKMNKFQYYQTQHYDPFCCKRNSNVATDWMKW